MSLVARIAEALTRTEDEGRRPALLLIGNLEAAELEAELYRPAKVWRGLFGDVIATDEECRPDLSLSMGYAEIWGVPVKRVDQDSLIGVMAEGYEG